MVVTRVIDISLGHHSRVSGVIDLTRTTLSRKMEVNINRKRLDSPDDSIDIWGIFTASCGGLKFGRISISWHWYDDFYVVGCRSTLELTFSLIEVMVVVIVVVVVAVVYYIYSRLIKMSKLS